MPNPHPPLSIGPDPLVPSAAHPLRVRARRLAAASRIEPHHHGRAQLACSATGVLRVTAVDHTCRMPPSRAVWIPPGVEPVVTVVEDGMPASRYFSAG